MAKMAKHTNYSDSVILKTMEFGGFDWASDGFRSAAEALGMRPTQVAARYYKLTEQGITYDDVKDYTEEDKENFYPGDGEKIDRTYDQGRERDKIPSGYKSYRQADSITTQETPNIMKKTIIVIYTNVVKKASEIGNTKKYCFNTESDVKEGDLISSSAYNTNIQVVKVLDKSHKYYNKTTGALSDKFTSTEQWLIKDLVIRTDDTETVYGSIVNKDRKE